MIDQTISRHRIVEKLGRVESSLATPLL